MKAVQSKHQSQRQSLLNARRKEFEVIELRFINVWNEMASKFKRELNDMEKHSAVKKMSLKAKNRLPIGVVFWFRPEELIFFAAEPTKFKQISINI